MEGLTFIQKLIVIVLFVNSGIMLGLDSANLSSCYVEFAHFSKKQDEFLTEMIYWYSGGAITGAIIFCLTKFKKRFLTLLLAGDLMVMLGTTITSYALSSSHIYLGRAFLGLGLTLNTLSMPLIMSKSWPNNSTIISMGGLTYQMGQLASQIMNTFYTGSWRGIQFSMIYATVPHLLLTGVSLTQKVFDSETQCGIFYILKNSKRSVLAALTVQVSSNIIGLKIISYLVPNISDDLPNYATIVSLFGSAVSIFLVHKLRRRVLILSGLFLLTVELALMSFYIQNFGVQMKELTICIYLFTLTSLMSSITIPYTLEVFPLDQKMLGIGFVGLLNEIVQVMIIVFLERLTRNKEMQEVFRVFTGTGLIMFVVALVTVFETKKGSDE